MARIVKKPEDRRSDIVNAACHLFQTKGYDQITMQAVMDYLDIAKGTIYHYFASKEALFEAVIEHIVNENVEYLQTLMQNTKGTALEKMKILIAAGNISTQNEKILDHLHQPGNNAMHTRLLAAALLKQAPLYAALIEQGRQEGIFKTSNPLECAEFILAGVQFLTDLGIYPWTHEDLERRVRAFPQLIEQQLQAAPGSFQFMVQHIKESNNL